MNKFYLTATALIFSSLAQAATYSNSNTTTVSPFGSPDTTNYGQVFKLGSSEKLIDWTFYASSGSVGDLKFVVAGWDGSKAVGPALYSAVGSYAGGAQALSFSNINTVLGAGTYISYLTVAGVSNPVSDVTMSGSDSDGGLDGSFNFLNSSGLDPLTINDVWNNFGADFSLQYTANLATAVPEPEVYALVLAGLAVLATVAGRRKSD